jgi:hypothetical protein
LLAVARDAVGGSARKENAMSIEKRVEAGAVFLDKHLGPGWEAKINIEKLSMNSCWMCTLGQLCDDDVKAANELEAPYYLMRDKLGLAVGRAADLGFHCSLLGGEEEYAGLTDSWRSLITQRCEAK